MISVDEFQIAAETEDFFAEDEALLLQHAIAEAPSCSQILEVGSYRGRSSRFILAAMSSSQRLTVDTLRVAASYRGHSYDALQGTLDDPHVAILPMSLRSAYGHLRRHNFQVMLVDADHSFVGASEDLCLCVALGDIDSILFCHDMDEELFPGLSPLPRCWCAARSRPPKIASEASCDFES